MPEGPEAHTIADQLEPYLVGNQIIAVKWNERAIHKGLDTIPTPITVMGSRAYGKKIVFYLDGGMAIITSLGMEGRWVFVPGKHSHIEILIRKEDAEFRLYFDDSRYFGDVTVVNNDDDFLAYFSTIGPDVLLKELSYDEWKERFMKYQGRKISYLLLEQNLVSGIGNYLRSEILYRARIHPHTKVGALSSFQMEKLRTVTYQTARESYYYGGFTIHSYWTPLGQAGGFTALVYGREGKKDEYGNIIECMKEGNRSIYWVPALQQY